MKDLPLASYLGAAAMIGYHHSMRTCMLWRRALERQPVLRKASPGNAAGMAAMAHTALQGGER